MHRKVMHIWSSLVELFPMVYRKSIFIMNHDGIVRFLATERQHILEECPGLNGSGIEPRTFLGRQVSKQKGSKEKTVRVSDIGRPNARVSVYNQKNLTTN